MRCVFKHRGAVHPAPTPPHTQVGIVMQKLIHALGFDSHAFARFRDAFDPRVSAGAAVKSFSAHGMQLNKIVTPRATEAARAHFKCAKLNGLPLENQERAPVMVGSSDPDSLLTDPETGCVRYIAKFKASTTLHRIREIAHELAAMDADVGLPAARANVTGNFSQSGAFKGIAACLTLATVEWLRDVPEVVYIETDAPMTIGQVVSQVAATQPPIFPPILPPSKQNTNLDPNVAV